MPDDQFAVILAGGSGERFWPLSRRATPKQLLKLFSDKTLLAETFDRVSGVVPAENILVLTNDEQLAAVREALTGRAPADNVLAEPAKRDTAPAIALAVAWAASRRRDAAMIVLPSDHLIRDTAAFQADVRRALRAAAATGALVTIGIRPTWACPSFGYIEQGEPEPDLGGPFHKVARFREKPSAELAETFLRAGNYRWNAGMFAWSVPAILSALAAHAPDLARFVETAARDGALDPSWRDAFPALPKISIDYAVMEKAERVLELDASFDWDDVGSWAAMEKYYPKDEAGNASQSPLTAVDAGGSIVRAEPGVHVALLGARDLIIIQTPDALLVARRSDAERIKQIVAALPPSLQ